MNINLNFGELHSNNSVNDKTNLFENYIPECYKVKRILISFNCFSDTYGDFEQTDMNCLAVIKYRIPMVILNRQT